MVFSNRIIMTSPIQHTIDTPYVVGPVHFYTAFLHGELVLFDTGPPTLEARRYLRKNVNLDQLKHIIVTHCHIDHFGQARWLERHSRGTVYIPHLDYLKFSDHERHVQKIYQLLSDLGFAPRYLGDLRRLFDSGALFPPFPKNSQIVERDLPPALGLTVLPCPGHSQSDLVYLAEDWAITGDTLVRGMSQSFLLDIDLTHGGRFKNYREYCDTLVKLYALESRRIYPAHRRTVPDIKSTIKFNVAKQLDRARQFHPFSRENDLMVQINGFADDEIRDAVSAYIKASEIIFLRDLLAEPELIRASLETIGLFEEVEGLYNAACLQSGNVVC
ncbi:MAG: MBL fold metallo-hydrolase [Desulforhopalus sp.]